MRLHAALHSLFKIVAFLLKLNYTQGNCQLGHQDKMFALKGHYVVLEEKFKLVLIFMISMRQKYNDYLTDIINIKLFIF